MILRATTNDDMILYASSSLVLMDAVNPGVSHEWATPNAHTTARRPFLPFYDWFSLGISASRSIWGSRLNNIDIIEKYTRILRHTLKRSDKHILWVVNRVNDYFILSRHFPFQRHDLNILERPLEPLLQKLVLWPGSLSLEVLERINCKSLNTTSTIFITKVNSGSNGQLAAAMQVYANN